MKNRLVSIAVLSAGLVATALAPHARATVALGERQNIQIGGFFSQGYLYSSANNYPTASKGGTWDFREMAFNVSTTLGSHIRVGGQAFAQTFGAVGDDKVILDWAVADYNVSPLLGFRVGRVKYPKGLYGEALDLDVVRPFVFLPNAVYSPILRDFSASFDGAMVYGSVNAGRSSVDYKLFHGSIPMSPRKGVAEFYNNAGLYSATTGVTRMSMDSVTGGQATWNTPVSGLKFAYSHSYYTNLGADGPFASFPAANLHSNLDHFAWNTASAEYVWRNWVFAAEWQRSRGGFHYSAPPVVPMVNDTVGWNGWYLSASRRLGSRFEIGSYYGDLKSNNSNRVGNDPLGFQSDMAISLRYDVSEHVLFKIEAHRIDGLYQTFNTTRMPNPAATVDARNYVFAAKTTFSF